MKRLTMLITPFVVLLLFAFSLNSYLNHSLITLSKTKNLSQLIYSNYTSVYEKDLFAGNNLLLMGSSELGSDVPQNPSKFFPFKDADYSAVLLGRAYVQTLQDSNILASFSNLSDKSKIALVVSIQWFYDKDGIEPTSFQANFSPAQFYLFLNNPKISEENKKYFCDRVYKLLEGTDIYASERLYARLYLAGNKGKLASYVFDPYFFLHKKMIVMKDKASAYKRLRTLPDLNSSTSTPPKSINWDEEYKKATKEGKLADSGTPYNISKDYYEKHLKGHEEGARRGLDKVSLAKSREMDDFRFYLSVCKDLGVKPYIILMSTNAYWYDTTGLTRERRVDFYNTLEKIAKNEGFDVLNLSNKEYEKYYYSDIMHLGWKGWLNVNEEIYKHFNKQ